MKKAALLLTFFTFLAFFSLIGKAQYYMPSGNYSYKDWMFYDYTIYQNGYTFFSAKFMNESKYFLIYPDSSGYVNVNRFDRYGVLEEARNCSIGVPYGQVIGNSYSAFGKYVFIPFKKGRDPKGTGILFWNVTDYLNGTCGFKSNYFYRVNEENDTSKTPYTELAISNYMTKGAYPSGIVEISDLTFALAYASDSGDLKLGWDFVGINTTTNEIIYNTLTKKEITWDSGLSDVQKFYVTASEGYCYYYSDCIFQIIFEGRSAQNDDRYGIYIREVRKGTFGWEFKDIGLVGFDEPYGFIAGQISGIDWWALGMQSFNWHRLYFRAKQGNDRIVAFIQFDEYWNYIEEKRLNRPETNALGPGIEGITETIGNSKYAKFDMVNLTNSDHTYIKFGASHWDGNGIYHGIAIYFRYHVYDAFNSSKHYVSSIWMKGCGYAYSCSVKGMIRVDITFEANLYNISLEVYTYVGTYRYPTQTVSAYLDIFDDYSNGLPNLMITEDSVYPLEAYAIYMPGYSYYNGVNKFGIQVVKESCICSEWVDQGCYNSTHGYMTRTCSPPNCDSQIKFYLNSSCGVTPPTCGNGVCDTGEDALNCPQDCPGYCGDGICNPYWENMGNCPEDCAPPLIENKTGWYALTSCIDIYAPGNYFLQKALIPTKNQSYCIRIFSSNVTIDMGNYGIDCTFSAKNNGTTTAIGIGKAGKRLKNITVKNGFIRNCVWGIVDYYNDNVTISNVRITMDDWAYAYYNSIYAVTDALYVEGVTFNRFEGIYVNNYDFGIYAPLIDPTKSVIYNSTFVSNVFDNIKEIGYNLFADTRQSVFYGCEVKSSKVGWHCESCRNNTVIKGSYNGEINGISVAGDSRYNTFAYLDTSKITLYEGTRDNLVCSISGIYIDKGNNTFRIVCPELFNITALNVTVAPPVFLTPIFVPSGLEILEFLFTPYFYLTLGAVGISGFLTYLTGNPLVFAGSMLVFIIAYTLMGAYPLWFSIILGLVVLATAFLLYRIGVRK